MDNQNKPPDPTVEKNMADHIPPTAEGKSQHPHTYVQANHPAPFPPGSSDKCNNTAHTRRADFQTLLIMDLSVIRDIFHGLRGLKRNKRYENALRGLRRRKGYENFGQYHEIRSKCSDFDMGNIVSCCGEIMIKERI